MNLTQIFKNFFLRKTNNLKNVIDPYWGKETFENEIAFKTEWYLSDSESEYNLHGKEKSIYGRSDIIYEIDKNGFRKFQNLNILSNDLIACFGCSNTFGIGLPCDDVWTSQLQKLLKTKYKVKNYGMSGYSTDGIARLVFNYLKQHSPKIICCFFPSIIRREIVIENFGILNFLNFEFEFEELKKQNYDSEDLLELKKIYEAYNIINKEKNNVYNFIKNLKFIEALCQANNVKFLWTTWDQSILSFDKNFFIDNIDKEHFVELTLEDVSNFDYARDGYHFGKNFNKKLANLFYEKIIK